MTDGLFSERSIAQALEILKNEIPFAIWETFYVTVLSTFFAVLIGLPLGVLLVAGEKDGVQPLPRWLMTVLNVLVNLLRSIPFLILMIMVIPLSRLIVGTSIGTVATVVPLVVARSGRTSARVSMPLSAPVSSGSCKETVPASRRVWRSCIRSSFSMQRLA